MKNENDINQIIYLFDKGYSLRNIGRELSCSQNTVKKYLNSKNIKILSKNFVHALKNKDDFLIAVYLGLWAGDGTHYIDKGYRVKFCCHSSNVELVSFIQKILLDLFDKTSHVLIEKRNRANVRFNSRFIFDFSKEYLDYGDNKTYTVHLKKDVNSYSKRFLIGFVLGLILTDGYLKDRLHFNVTSPKLAENMYQILNILHFNPSIYIHKRAKYGWQDLYMVSLRTSESKDFLNLMDKVLLDELGYEEGFSVLKGYKIKK